LDAGYHTINGTGWFFGIENDIIDQNREQKRLEK
jgi:hypothetical protein